MKLPSIGLESSPRPREPMKLAVLGLGIVAPEAAGCAAYAARRARPPPEKHTVQDFGDAGDLKTKRMPRLDRMTLAAAREALGDASRERLSVVFGTGYGGLQATVDFLEGVASRGNSFGSPTAFHQSVHHAPLGQLSIALQITGACLTTSQRERSGESALKIGMDLLAAGRADRVLVVAADEITPVLVKAYQAFEMNVSAGEGAAAVLLGRELAGTELTLECTRVNSSEDMRAALRLEHALLFPPDVEGAGNRRWFRPAQGTFSSAVDSARVVDETPYLGFNPSGGLLRLVAAALRLRQEGGTAVLRGLVPGTFNVLSRA
ncbi:MAG: beta-ketoacyl synthase chain length factor [Myxococcaceae bacterium]